MHFVVVFGAERSRVQVLFDLKIGATTHPAFESRMNLPTRQVDGAGTRGFRHRANGRTVPLARASTLTARQVVVSLDESFQQARMSKNAYGVSKQDSHLRPTVSEFKDQ